MNLINRSKDIQRSWEIKRLRKDSLMSDSCVCTIFFNLRDVHQTGYRVRFLSHTVQWSLTKFNPQRNGTSEPKHWTRGSQFTLIWSTTTLGWVTRSRRNTQVSTYLYRSVKGFLEVDCGRDRLTWTTIKYLKWWKNRVLSICVPPFFLWFTFVPLVTLFSGLNMRKLF